MPATSPGPGPAAPGGGPPRPNAAPDAHATPTSLAAPAHSYAHVPKPMRPPTRFTLRGETLTIDDGRRETTVPLGAVAAVRLTFEIKNTLSRGFRTGIRLSGGGRYDLTNVSWRRLSELERHDEAYTRFVLDLVRRAAAANPAIRLEAGQPPARWWALVAAAFLTGLGLVVLTVRALAEGALPFAGLLGVFALSFGWLLADLGRRNRPRAFAPGTVPADLLPADPGPRP